jgi:uncharacterized membrane protein YesL
MASYEKYANNPLFIFAGKMADVMILSCLWILFCLPVFTAGASSAALYHAVTKRFLKKSETPTQDFMHALRLNLKQGAILSAIYVIYGAFVAFNIYVSFASIEGAALPDFYKQISIALLLPIFLTLPFVFPYLSRFTAGTLLILKNSFTFCAIHPLHAVLMMLLILASGVSMFIFPPLALFVPTGCAYLCSKWIEKDFAKAMTESQKRLEEAEIAESGSGTMNCDEIEMEGISNEERNEE